MSLGSPNSPLKFSITVMLFINSINSPLFVGSPLQRFGSYFCSSGSKFVYLHTLPRDNLDADVLQSKKDLLWEGDVYY